MNFGWSAGDLWTTAEKLNQLRKKYCDAPNLFKQLFGELRSLSLILEDTDLLVSLQDDLDNGRIQRLREIVASCDIVHTDMESLLQKYIILGDAPTAVGQRVKRSWKRLILEPEEIQTLRARITSNVVLLQTFITASTTIRGVAISSKVSQIDSNISTISEKLSVQGNEISQIASVATNVSTNLSEVVDYQELERHQALLTWISEINHEAILADVLARRQLLTGFWFFKTKAFLDWIDASLSATILCVGAPGIGKTILTSVVIDHLRASFGTDVDVGIAYFYYTFERTCDEKTMLSSLLKQLLTYQRIPASASLELNKIRMTGRKPSLAEIKDQLRLVITRFSKVFLVVDALDECQSKELRQVAKTLTVLQNASNIHLLATARPIPDVLTLFDRASIYDIQAQVSDIQAYLNTRASQMALVRRQPEILDTIVQSIIGGIDGVFLLARLYMDSVEDKTTVKALKIALQDLSKGSDAYDNAYEKAMERIKKQPKDRAKLATEIVMWLVCAKEDLTSEALIHALGVEENTSSLDPENLLSIDDIISACAGIVTWDKKVDIVRLVHHTAQEYFIRTRASYFPHGDSILAIRCVTYLAYDAWKQNNNRRRLYNQIYQKTLYGYAARNWGHHCRAGKTKFESVAFFLEDSVASTKACEALYEWHNSEAPGHYPRKDCKHCANFNMCVIFGLADFVTALYARKHSFEPQNLLRNPLLHLATRFNHPDMVAALLKINSIDINAKRKGGVTPLMEAVSQDHVAVTHVLLQDQRINTEARSSTGYTALMLASQHGHAEIVRMMLQNSCVDVSAELVDGETALMLAARNNCSEVILALFQDRRIDVNAKNALGETALILVAQHSHSSILNIMLENGSIDINIRTDEGYTALMLSARHDKAQIVELLLKDGRIDPNVTTDSMWTALTIAAFHGHAEILRILLEDGRANPEERAIACIANHFARPEASKGVRYTPLMLAVMQGHLDVVRLLLQDQRVNKQARIDLADIPITSSHPDQDSTPDRSGNSLINCAVWIDDGCTPLMLAASVGQLDVVLLLLGIGVDVLLQDCSGRTAWHYALAYSLIHESGLSILDVLAGAGCDMGTDAIDGISLIWPILTESPTAMSRLFARSTNFNAPDRSGRIALHYAATTNNGKLVQKLLDAGADSSITDNRGETPLMLSIRTESLEATRILIKHHSSMPINNSDCQTALRLAVTWVESFECQQIIQELAVAGYAINCIDKEGDTPLMHAIRYHKTYAIVNTLINHGAQVDICDKRGNTALHVACHNPPIIARLLATGCTVDPANEAGQTPLMVCAGLGYGVSAMKILLAAGANVNAVDKNGYSVLCTAICGGWEGHVRLLLDANAQIMPKKQIMKNPLHLAAGQGRLDLVKILVEQGNADVLARDDQGETASDIATKIGGSWIVNYLDSKARTQNSRPVETDWRASWPDRVQRKPAFNRRVEATVESMLLAKYMSNEGDLKE